MRTLKDVYIKVTKANANELMKQINRYDLQPHTYVFFAYDSIKGNEVSLIEPKNRKKVSLSQLKRLIDTIPTREEITRLKRQISAYKTNYDKVVKHSLSKEDVIEELTADNKWLKYRLKESRDEQNSLKTLYDDALKLNDDILEISEYFREQYILAQSELARLKNKKWWQIWK